MKKQYYLFSFFLLPFLSSAQGYDREISYGVSLGAVHSKISEIKPSIIPEHLYQGYNTKEKPSIGVSGGIFLNWKYPEKKLSIQPELSYSHQKTDFAYDDVKGLNYNIRYNYHYLNAGFLLKYYPFEGLYVGAGPFFGFNLSKDDLTYTSNGAEMMQRSGVYFEPDAVVQRVLKESFKGKDYFYLGFALGYEFENGLGIGARYHLGLSDVMATEDNGHRFRDTKNKLSGVALQVSYRFTFDGQNNF